MARQHVSILPQFEGLAQRLAVDDAARVVPIPAPRAIREQIQDIGQRRIGAEAREQCVAPVVAYALALGACNRSQPFGQIGNKIGSGTGHGVRLARSTVADNLVGTSGRSLDAARFQGETKVHRQGEIAVQRIT